MLTNLIASLLISNTPVRVAVIDTGYTKSDIYNASLCDGGHKDFTEDQKYDNGVPVDFMGHGTHIAGLIHQYTEGVSLQDSDTARVQYEKIKKLNIKDSDYCLVIVKAFSKSGKLENYINAIDYVKRLKDVSIVNISAGGDSLSVQEKSIIDTMLNEKKIIIAAAGNSTNNIDIDHYYPASLDKRIIVVGNSETDEIKETQNQHFTKEQFRSIFSTNPTSNYGSDVDVFVKGTKMLSISHIADRLAFLTGTSQSTAVFTGLVLKNIKIQKKEKK